MSIGFLQTLTSWRSTKTLLKIALFQFYHQARPKDQINYISLCQTQSYDSHATQFTNSTATYSTPTRLHRTNRPPYQSSRSYPSTPTSLPKMRKAQPSSPATRYPGATALANKSKTPPLYPSSPSAEPGGQTHAAIGLNLPVVKRSSGPNCTQGGSRVRSNSISRFGTGRRMTWRRSCYSCVERIS